MYLQCRNNDTHYCRHYSYLYVTNNSNRIPSFTCFCCDSFSSLKYCPLRSLPKSDVFPGKTIKQVRELLGSETTYNCLILHDLVGAVLVFLTSVLVSPAGHRLSLPPPDPPRLRHRVTGVSHSSPRCPQRQKGHRSPTQRPVGVGWCPPRDRAQRPGGAGRRPPGDRLLGPQKRTGSTGAEGFPSFPEAFPACTFVSVPVFGFSFLWKAFGFSGVGH